MNVPELACPLCRATSCRTIKTFDEPRVSVGQCRACGLLYTWRPHPTPHELFADATSEEIGVLMRPILEGRVRHFRTKNFEEYLAIIERHAPGRRLLDVGCAHGFFPAMAVQRGWSAVVVEPNEVMARFARERQGLDVLHGHLATVDLGDRVFDAISFTDSAEYLLDPLGDIARAISHLASGGVVFIKVPNGDYFRLRNILASRFRLKGGEEPFSPPQRVVHYTLDTLRQLAVSLGLDVLTTQSCRPVNSPIWFKMTGLWLEIESPWFLGAGQKAIRRVLQALGRAEELVTRRNHLSPAIYVLARRRTSS